SRRAARLAHLVRLDRRSRRRRGAHTLARLGVREEQGRAAQGGVTVAGDCCAIHVSLQNQAQLEPPAKQVSHIADNRRLVMAPKVLISDALSPAAVQIFKDRGLEVDFQPKLGSDKEKLAELVGDFDGLAIRSATKVTPKVLERAKKLKVI